MTSSQISAELRARLRVEAGDRCGYCHTQQALQTRRLWVQVGWHPPRP